MNFSNSVTEIQQKYERERKSGREKILNFSNHITEIPAAQLADRKSIVAMPLPK